MPATPVGFFWRSSLPILAVVIATVGCEANIAEVNEAMTVASLRLNALEEAEPMKGVWTGVVTDAVDHNNAAFGREPSDWVGRTVTGTFSIHPAMPGLRLVDTDPEYLIIEPSGPYVDFVEITAVIDGVVFRTACERMEYIFFGDVLVIQDQAGLSSFRPQDSCVGIRNGGVARAIVGFDAYFAGGAVTFDGRQLSISGVPQFAVGVIDELLDVAGPDRRQGTIFFDVTEVTLSALSGVSGMLLQFEASGDLSSQQAAALRDKVEEIDAKLAQGNLSAACLQLTALANQVQAFIRSGKLEADVGQALLAEVQEVRDAVDC